MLIGCVIGKLLIAIKNIGSYPGFDIVLPFVADFGSNDTVTIIRIGNKGQSLGIVDNAIIRVDGALFILSTIEGVLGMTKNHQNKEVYHCCGRELKHYLNTLKAQ